MKQNFSISHFPLKRLYSIQRDIWGMTSQKDPIRAPSLPVALTEELGEGAGGLRKVTPKGSLVTDCLESMVARNMISKKRLGGRWVMQGKKRNKLRGAKGTENIC